MGAERLALLEAITYALDGVLTELGEHASVVGDVTPDALTARVAACDAACDWMFPIGSRDWLGQMRAPVAHRSAPAWVPRVEASLTGGG